MNHCTKILTILFFSFTIINSAVCQDIIYKNNGEEVKAKISEITPLEIVYKLYDYPEGPQIHLLKELVFRIQYGNGTVEIIHHDESILSRYDTPEALHNKGELDAVMNYKGYRAACNWTMAITLLCTPPVGLFVAIPSSLIKPKIKTLNYPDSKLFEKHEYQKGYQKRAKRMKTKRVWVNFLVGSIIWSSFVYLLSKD